jgi:hypothetical protein
MYKYINFDIWVFKKYYVYYIMALQLKVKNAIQKIEHETKTTQSHTINAPFIPQPINTPFIPPIVLPPRIEISEPIDDVKVEITEDVKVETNEETTDEIKVEIKEIKDEHFKIKTDYSIVKLDYLVFCDEYNSSSWTSYPLWCHLTEKEKDWWLDYVSDINERMKQMKESKFKDFLND